jgi:hypothetical protein
MIAGGAFTIWDLIEGSDQAYEDTMKKMKPIQDEIDELEKELNCDKDKRRR